MKNEIKRTIRFYAIDWIKKDESHVSKSQNFLQHIIEETQFITYNNNTEKLVFKKASFSKIDSDIESCWVLSRLRQSDFPQISDMDATHVEPLRIADGKGLVDPVHFMLFSNGAFLGTEANKQSRDVPLALKNLVNKWIQQHEDCDIKEVNFNQIKRNNIDDETFAKISKIAVSSSLNYQKNLESKNNSITEAFQDSNTELTMTFQIKDRKEKDSLFKFIPLFKSIFKDYSEKPEQFSLFEVSGVRKSGDGRFETVNILDDYMVVKKSIVRLDDNTKAVDSNSMFETIKSTYSENKNHFNAYMPRMRE